MWLIWRIVNFPKVSFFKWESPIFIYFLLGFCIFENVTYISEYMPIFLIWIPAKCMEYFIDWQYYRNIERLCHIISDVSVPLQLSWMRIFRMCLALPICVGHVKSPDDGNIESANHIQYPKGSSSWTRMGSEGANWSRRIMVMKTLMRWCWNSIWLDIMEY